MFVSIVLAAYNDERWLPHAVESVLRQTHRDFELLLVDDGSTDGTAALIDRFAHEDARVRVVRHPNMGLARSLNVGFEAARAAWVARMDADDVMRPNRLERQLDFVRQHPGLAASAPIGVFINERSKQVGRKHRARYTTPGAARQAFERGEVVQLLHSAAMLRRDAVLAVGGYRPQFTVTEDADLWIRLLEAGYELLEQPEYLQAIRFRQVSASGGGLALQQRQLRWVAACSRQRRAGLPEPTYAAFIHEERSGPRLQRWNLDRKDLANDHFHQALWAYANGNHVRMARGLAVSALFAPRVTTRRVWPHLAHKLRPARATRMARPMHAASGMDSGPGT
jgi:glycosyltransferase involved in cell wall biosynthesis